MSWETAGKAGRVRVRSRRQADRDAAVAVRHRAERLAAVASTAPPGMAPGAVLVIRRLQTTVRAGPDGSWSARTASAVLDRALRDEVAQLYRTASRPVLGPPPATARSVLFADEAELLVCLARDVLADRARTRWYWQQILAGAPASGGAALAAAWCARAAALPAALVYLGTEEGAAAIRLLSPPERESVVRALQRAYDLPAMVDDSDSEPPGASSPAAPWSRWLPPDRLHAAPEVHHLLGLSLALAHAPACARSELFAQQTAAWWRAVASGRPEPANEDLAAAGPGRAAWPGGDGEAGRRPASPGPDPPAAAFDGASIVSRPGSEACLPAVLPGGVGEAPRAGRGTPAAAARPGDRAGEREPARQAGDTPDFSDIALARIQGAGTPSAPADDGRREQAAGGGQPAPVEEAPARPAWAIEGVATGLAGALFLINLLAHLRLPGVVALDDGAPLSDYVGAWALVEAFARGLLGRGHDRYAQDPLWAMLAELDGREPPEPAGALLPPVQAFRLPTAWLRGPPWAEGRQWVAEVRGGRLLVADMVRRYLVADLPYGGAMGTAAEQVAALATAAAGERPAVTWGWGRVPRLPSLTRRAAAALGRPAGWWLRRSLAFVRSHLAWMLGTPPGEVGRALLVRPGRVHAGRTHVDLTMPMDSASLPIRRAGLDADPGWMPDLGRIVLFHFE